MIENAVIKENDVIVELLEPIITEKENEEEFLTEEDKTPEFSELDIREATGTIYGKIINKGSNVNYSLGKIVAFDEIAGYKINLAELDETKFEDEEFRLLNKEDILMVFEEYHMK